MKLFALALIMGACLQAEDAATQTAIERSYNHRRSATLSFQRNGLVQMLKVEILYRDAVGCANLLSLHLPDVTTCDQDVMVLGQDTDMEVKSFVVVIAYTDEFGLRQLQNQPASYQPQANPELAIVTTAASFASGVDGITNLSATVVDDAGRAVTVKLPPQP